MVPEKGSVGASGDLAPLAHLSLTLIGEGEAFYKGERMATAQALSQAGLQPVTLEAKEGLALLNGTQAMHATGGLALLRAKRLSRVADIAGAMTLEALKGTPAAFDARIHNARPHPVRKQSQSICSGCCEIVRFVRLISLAIHVCRTPTACAACRRCMAQSVARSITARKFSPSSPARRRTTRSCLR
jgi:hypothetical protein